MKPFRERNPVTVGLSGLATLGVLFLAVFFFDDLPLVGGDTHTAEFTEAAGLKPDDEVRVHGLKVGSVSTVALAGDRVAVTFRVSGVELGDKTGASIRIKTLLGQKYLALDPQGSGSLGETPIPRERTQTPFDVSDAFQGLTDTIGQIDTGQLAQSFQVLSETFRDSPEHVRKALDGMSALSTTIASRDAELAKVLANSKRITQTLSDRNDQIAALLQDGNKLLAEIRHRREQISLLLRGTRDLAKELTGLVRDNRAQLGPALEQLDRLAEILQRNQDNLGKALALSGPYYRLLNNPLGNGRWVDSYVCGLLPPTTGEEGCVPPKGYPR
ncbi:phospholipid/cholesterol/gamma-HCH transport system substrate-binding protein [Crossiella equi]|uniref:Phospholipid/cholesterol/gamma-HCH transport system substrate-binding protein n=1 Tax=Crossiella equi TaxID=130796 RepID=A0ABS5AMK9_9PSEU|nr:MCE family protein [Crossiella equi]MBP2477791.1 phospholipid/cholesterol/gamma-HCH transport system substrate-binding protein [Crossiella equi]